MTPFIRKSIANDVKKSKDIYSASLQTVLTQGDLVYDKKNKVLYHFDGKNTLKRLSNTLQLNKDGKEPSEMQWDLGNGKVKITVDGKETEFTIGTVNADMDTMGDEKPEDIISINKIHFGIDYQFNDATPYFFITLPQFNEIAGGQLDLYFFDKQELLELFAQQADFEKRIKALESKLLNKEEK